MTLEVRTERLTLRTLSSEDRASWMDLHERSENHLRRWVPRSSEPLDQQFDRALARASDSDRHFLGVAVLKDGDIAGLFNLNEIVRGVFQSAYASWLLAARHTGKGYASEAVSALLDLAFSRVGGIALHRVQANIMPENVKSVRLAERVGMRLEGKAERYLQIAGEWREHLMYAKTTEEHSALYLS